MVDTILSAKIANILDKPTQTATVTTTTVKPGTIVNANSVLPGVQGGTLVITPPSPAPANFTCKLRYKDGVTAQGDKQVLFDPISIVKSAKSMAAPNANITFSGVYSNEQMGFMVAFNPIYVRKMKFISNSKDELMQDVSIVTCNYRGEVTNEHKISLSAYVKAEKCNETVIDLEDAPIIFDGRTALVLQCMGDPKGGDIVMDIVFTVAADFHRLK
jgi:hypothetical protein